MSEVLTNTFVYEGDVRIPADLFDLGKFRRWVHSDDFPDRGKVSFLSGEIDIDLSPENIETHSKLKGDLYGALWALVREHDLGELLPDGALLLNEPAGLVTEPDMLFCSWESLQTGRVQYRASGEQRGQAVEVVGSPDLTIEVVSRTSVRKDTRLLPALYFAADVREYWLVDARAEEIDFQLRIRGDDDYLLVDPDESGFRESRVLGVGVRLTRELNPVGGFRYSLELR